MKSHHAVTALSFCLLPLSATAGHLITNETVSLNRIQVIQIHDPSTGASRNLDVHNHGEPDQARPTPNPSSGVKGYTADELRRFIDVFGRLPPEK